MWAFVFGITQWVFCLCICNVVSSHTRGMSSRGWTGDAVKHMNLTGHYCKTWVNENVYVVILRPVRNTHVSAFLYTWAFCPFSLFLSYEFPSACVCVFALGETWEGPASGQAGQTDGRTCQNVTEREESSVENKGGREGEKASRSWTVEKVERDGAPDLTTLTHSGLSLLASCALWSIRRGHTRTHIYLSTHAGDEDILGLCAGVCVRECVFGSVFECDSLSMRAKESVDATKNPTVCVCFPSSLCAFVFMSPNLYAHLCVYTYIYTSAGLCWCSFPSVFLAWQREPAGYWCAASPRVPLHHPGSFARASTCESRLRTISDVEHKRSN